MIFDQKKEGTWRSKRTLRSLWWDADNFCEEITLGKSKTEGWERDPRREDGVGGIDGNDDGLRGIDHQSPLSFF